MHPVYQKGRIIEINGSWTCVKLLSDNLKIKARTRGKFKIQEDDAVHNPVIPAVGDIVELSMQDGDFLIEHIQPRKTIFSRIAQRQNRNQVMASNIDQVLIIASMRAPFVPFVFIDSVVVTAAAEKIDAIIIFNKTDLYSKEELQKAKKYQALYHQLGYPCFLTQINKGKNMDALVSLLQHKLSLLIGFSGCGKSSLIEYLLPEENIFINEVGSQHLGVHTTTFSTLYDLPFGGQVIDSPGIRSYHMPKMDASELRMYFKEFVALQPSCAFVSCTHIHEKKCAVLRALEQHHIAMERYFTYKTNFDYLKRLHDAAY